MRQKGTQLIKTMVTSGILGSSFPWAIADVIMADYRALGSFRKTVASRGLSLASVAIAAAQLIAACVGHIGPGILTEAFSSLEHENGVMPASFVSELVISSTVEINFVRRACRADEREDRISQCVAKTQGTRELCQLQLPKTCRAMKFPIVRHTTVDLEWWNRLSLKIGVPGGVSFDPLIGLEIDFDVTPVFTDYLNKMRAVENEARVQKCLRCVRAGTAFCNKKGYVVGYRAAWDRCVKLSDPIASRKSCLTAKPLMDPDRKPAFIMEEASCHFSFVRVNEDFPPELSTGPGRIGMSPGQRLSLMKKRL